MSIGKDYLRSVVIIVLFFLLATVLHVAEVRRNKLNAQIESGEPFLRGGVWYKAIKVDKVVKFNTPKDKEEKP